MEPNPNMLDFVKAMADAERLRIIGVLAHRPAAATEVASELGIPMQDAFAQLEMLQSAGILRKADELYELDPAGLEALSKRQFGGEPREQYVPAPDLDAKSRKVLAGHLNPDGTIRQIPSQAGKLRIILEYLITAFTPGASYTEKEVNTILRRFHLDTAGLRRDLVDAGLLDRESDGSRYWRVK